MIFKGGGSTGEESFMEGDFFPLLSNLDGDELCP